MTFTNFEEARKYAKEYDFLIGRRTKKGDTFITAIRIGKAKDGNYTPYAEWHTGGMVSGQDPLELYDDLKALQPQEKRSYKVYIPREFPFGITTYDDVINRAYLKWMEGKTFQEVLPYLIEKKAQVIEVWYEGQEYKSKNIL